MSIKRMVLTTERPASIVLDLTAHLFLKSDGIQTYEFKNSLKIGYFFLEPAQKPNFANA